MKKWFEWDLATMELDDQEFEQELLGRGDSSEGIFGKFSLAQFLMDLEHLGLLDTLRARGYQSFRPHLDRKDPFSEQVTLSATHPKHEQELLLMDVKSHRASIISPWGQRYRALGWDWVKLQDPTAKASVQRPTLPGQEYPGLGLFRSLIELMFRYVDSLDIEALTAIPLYFHNAYLYSESFYFLEAKMQGRFRALCRDLMPLGLAQASWLVADKKVEIVNRKSGESAPFEWSAALIVKPIAEEMKQRLQASEYVKAALLESDSIEFRVLLD